MLLLVTSLTERGGAFTTILYGLLLLAFCTKVRLGSADDSGKVFALYETENGIIFLELIDRALRPNWCVDATNPTLEVRWETPQHIVNTAATVGVATEQQLGHVDNLAVLIVAQWAEGNGWDLPIG